MTALEQVKRNRIFEFEIYEGVTSLVERCDGYYQMEVDKEFILKLADELKQYAEKM